MTLVPSFTSMYARPASSAWDDSNRTDEDEGVSMTRQSHPSARGGQRQPDLSRRALLTSTGVLGGAAPAQAEGRGAAEDRSEEHTSELQSRFELVCRLLLAKKTSTSRLT